MGLTAVERSTTVNFDDEGEEAYIVTYNRPWITNLRKNPDAREVTADSVKKFGGAEFMLPKQLISPPRRKRTDSGISRAPMSEAHKAKLAAGRAAKKMREAIEQV